MYRVTHITLHNICQYSNAAFSIDPGLTAVCGRNGNGKTNLLRALAYGLTGLVDGNWGSQQTLQKDGTVEPGYVIVTVSGGSVSLDIKRYSVSGAKFPDSVSRTEGDTASIVASRRREVDSYLEGVFGISCQLLFQICWGRQNQLAMLLTAPSSVVSTFLSGIFNTKKLETLRDKLKLSISTIAPMEDMSQKIAETRASLSELPDVEALEKQAQEVHGQFIAADEQLKLLQKSAVSSITHDEWTARLSAVTKSIEGIREELRTLAVPDDFDRDTPDVERLLGDVCRAIAEKQDLLRSITTGIRERSSLADAARAELTDMRVTHDGIVARLHTCGTTCELCGGTISELSVYQKKRCLQLTGYETEEAYAASYLESVDRKKTDLSSYETAMLELKDKEKEVNDELVDLLSNKELLEQVVAMARRRDMANLLKERLAVQEASKAGLEAQQPLSEEDTARLSELSAKCKRLQELERSLVSEIAAAKATKELLTTNVADMEKHQEQYEINTGVRSVLTGLRDAFSQPRAQARYLASKIAELNAKLAAFMSATDLPFSLGLNPQTHLFEYTTSSGHVHPAGHLSGAQLNISAVLLQTAIFEVVQPQINLFLVDEPSEALDDQNKTMMAGLFQRMNNLLPAIDGVMLIVTRDWQLIDSCNNQINISEESYEGE